MHLAATTLPRSLSQDNLSVSSSVVEVHEAAIAVFSETQDFLVFAFFFSTKNCFLSFLCQIDGAAVQVIHTQTGCVLRAGLEFTFKPLLHVLLTSEIACQSFSDLRSRSR